MRLALKEIKAFATSNRGTAYTNEYALSNTKQSLGARTDVRTQVGTKAVSNDSNESILRETKTTSAIVRTQEFIINHGSQYDLEAQSHVSHDRQ
jgi:hypothetical protein